MRIKTQFIITMALFGIILVVMAVSAIVTHQLTKRAREQERIASSIAQGANELSYLANDYLIYRESQQLKRWQSRFASFSAQVANLRAERPDQQALVANIRANQTRLKQVFDSVASAPAGPARSQKLSLDAAYLQVSWSRMAVQSQGLVSDASRLSQLLHQRVDQLRNRRTMLIYVMVSLFGIFLLTSYMLTYRRILKSVAKLQASTAVIGLGNLDFKIEEKENDEIGDLAHAFNRMTTDLRAVIASKTELEKEIVERKRALAALAESEARFRAVFESSSDCILVWDRQYNYLYANRAAIDHVGTTRDKVIGKNIHDGLGHLPDFMHLWMERVDRAFTTGESFRVEDAVPVGERLVHSESQISPIRDAAGQIFAVGVVYRDITERKHTEEALRQRTLELQQLTETLEQRVYERTEELEVMNEELTAQIDECQKIETDLRKSQTDLRQLSAALINAQERERKLIAQEIHDSMGASLAATKFKVETVLNEIGETNPHASSALEDVVPIIQGTIEEARRIQMSLRPSILDDLGILATINWFCRQFETTYSNIRIRKEIEVEEHEVPEFLKIVIYRILQEALNNIAKHSKALVVLLLLRKVGRAIELVIRDSGQGFDLAEARSRKGRGLGLESMRERAELSGGFYSIESSMGKGTVIRASWHI